jgi:hypothetical protein
VIKKVNAEFIPVSVGAARLHNPNAPDDEGRMLYAIGRTAPVPQGLAVLNGDGQPLAWTLGFDDDAHVLAFLGHVKKRFEQSPAGEKQGQVERYRSYPSQPLDPISVGPYTAVVHAKQEPCSAVSREPAGTLALQVFGRALDAAGKPLPHSVNQEHYAQDRFSLPPDAQAALLKWIRDGEKEPSPLPDWFSRECLNHAFLGQIDVRPLDNPLGGRTSRETYELRSRRGEEAAGVLTVPVEGESDVACAANAMGGFRHAITLKWEGFLQFRGDRLTRVVLSAKGNEQLHWGLPPSPEFGADRPLVSRLMAGRKVDFEGSVRYGVLGSVPQLNRAIAPARADHFAGVAASAILLSETGARSASNSTAACVDTLSTCRPSTYR